MGGGLLAERDRPEVVHQQVVEDQRLLVVDRAVVGRLGRPDEQVPVQAEILLHILAHVWVIPVDPGVAEKDLVPERLAVSDWRLGHRSGRRRSGCRAGCHASAPVVGSGISLRKLTMIVAPRGARMSGPGYIPL